eukprot:CAMPEP_0180052902 /NCGR_PEP_ID=MMETSP0985-20121206/1979_1 /TAXON_ID=483367 /ORGANISM="non described non described, Strain CCMP 2436" /LENGTH=205 /DNA_ID=CAMNT_0021982335 /DNA_START=511 /DNA_END=1126 /DNA_ORIENTATION=+
MPPDWPHRCSSRERSNGGRIAIRIGRSAGSGANVEAVDAALSAPATKVARALVARHKIITLRRRAHLRNLTSKQGGLLALREQGGLLDRRRRRCRRAAGVAAERALRAELGELLTYSCLVHVARVATHEARVEEPGENRCHAERDGVPSVRRSQRAVQQCAQQRVKGNPRAKDHRRHHALAADQGGVARQRHIVLAPVVAPSLPR